MDFGKHSNKEISKVQKGILVIKKLYNILPRNALLTIYKFVGPHLDYGNIVYDQPNQSFLNKIEAVQYKAVLAIYKCNKRNF